MRVTTAYKPKSKRRIMRRFVLDEISVVDNPAQAGAVATIMKAAGNTIMSTKGQTVFDDIRNEMRAAWAKLEKMEKMEKLDRQDRQDRQDRARQRAAHRDLRNQQREAPYLNDEDEYEHEYEGEGPEFEKEPINTLEGDAKRTAADHEGDWPGQGTQGGARRRPTNTRTDGHVSPDESEMTPERASDLLQPYAQDEDAYDDERDEDEEGPLTKDEMDEAEAAYTVKAHDLMKRDPRMSPQHAYAMALQRVGDALDVQYIAKRGYQPTFGREREIMRRQQAAQPVSKTYSDDELAERLGKRFGPEAVEHAYAMAAARDARSR